MRKQLQIVTKTVQLLLKINRLAKFLIPSGSHIHFNMDRYYFTVAYSVIPVKNTRNIFEFLSQCKIKLISCSTDVFCGLNFWFNF